MLLVFVPSFLATKNSGTDNVKLIVRIRVLKRTVFFSSFRSAVRFDDEISMLCLA